MKIILATHNTDKRKEMMAALTDLNVEILSLVDFPQVGEIVEDGETLTENAIIKAKAVFDITGIPAISDDTGLSVDALHGAPGVYSARYAGENATYDDNVEYFESNRISKCVKKITNLQAQHSNLFYGFYYAATSSFFSAFFDTFGCINSYNINSAISVDVCTLAFSKVSY